jgi:hypothetical protein
MNDYVRNIQYVWNLSLSLSNRKIRNLTVRCAGVYGREEAHCFTRVSVNFLTATSVLEVARNVSAVWATGPGWHTWKLSVA